MDLISWKSFKKRKTNSTDEFLVKKGSSHFTPDYDSVPEPKTSMKVEKKRKIRLKIF